MVEKVEDLDPPKFLGSQMRSSLRNGTQNQYTRAHRTRQALEAPPECQEPTSGLLTHPGAGPQYRLRAWPRRCPVCARGAQGPRSPERDVIVTL